MLIDSIICIDRFYICTDRFSLCTGRFGKVPIDSYLSADKLYLCTDRFYICRDKFYPCNDRFYLCNGRFGKVLTDSYYYCRNNRLPPDRGHYGLRHSVWDSLGTMIAEMSLVQRIHGKNRFGVATNAKSGDYHTVAARETKPGRRETHRSVSPYCFIPGDMGVRGLNVWSMGSTVMIPPPLAASAHATGRKRRRGLPPRAKEGNNVTVKYVTNAFEEWKTLISDSAG